jgi:DNA-binding transcriptional LysR family regulator
MIEIYQIKYFLAVVETGSFTKASQRACVTQPTLSAGIKKLETALGARLFDRSSKRIFLTESGSKFIDRAKSVLHQINLAQTEIQDLDTPKLLKIGVLVTVPSASIKNILQPFMREENGLTIEIFEGSEQEILSRLDEGRIHVALSILRSGMKLKTAPLYKEKYSLFVASHHPLARKKSIHPSELVDEGAIIRSRCEILSESSRFFTDYNVRPRLVYRTAQDERALQMVAAGIGFTTMPDHYQMEGVKAVTLEGYDFKREIGLIEADGLSPEKQALTDKFIRFATEHVAYMTYTGKGAS